jgi:5-formyltetrahydrofolate cyclo-ligase
LKNKQQLRTHFRHRRNQITFQKQSEAANALCELLKHSTYFQHDTFSCYLPQDGELDLMPFIQLLWNENKRCVLPVVGPERVLSFSPYHAESKLEKNTFGILESQNEMTVPLQEIDMVLVPLVAFDNKGGRLGMGGGYYDATFSETKHRPLMVGVAHSCQQADSVPMDSWDVPLDAVITESGVIGSF